MRIEDLIPALIQQISTIEAAQTTAAATLASARTTAQIALVAAILSFVGVIVTGVITRRNGFVQARTTQQLKHAGFWQKWIDELRAEMARFTLLVASGEAMTAKRAEVLQSMQSIIMRMDREDEDHDRLQTVMMSLIQRFASIGPKAGLTDEAADDFGKATGEFVRICQAILKREWEVLKHDMHATPWGWPLNAIASRRRRRRRAERVERNRRIRANEPPVENTVLLDRSFLRVEMIARTPRRKRTAIRIGRLVLQRSNA